MPKKATIKYRSLRSNLVHLPLSLYAQLAQSQTRPQGIIVHLSALLGSSSSSKAGEAYLGWSGLAAASSLGLTGVGDKDVLETLEVDPEVAASLGLPEGTIVEISIIHNPVKARSISVTPLSSDDWEILEQNASFLEDNLLSQLRAAKKGQEIDVWVKGRTKIKIRVDETDPGTSTAVVLNHDTEVYVAPRPRGLKPKTPEPQIIQPASSLNAGKKAAGNGSTAFRARLIPSRVAASWGRPDEVEKEGKVLLCAPNVLDRARRKFGADEDVYVRLDMVGEPKDEQKGPVESEETKANGEEKEDEGVQAWLVPWAEIPHGFVVLPGKTHDRWQEWGNVRISAVTAPRKAKTKIAPAPLEISAPEKFEPLAGTDKIVASCTSYLRRMAVSDRPRPLLLTGAKGSGKTSLTRLLGRIVESDRELLSEVIYEDVARIDGEGRVSTVKEKISAWLAQAESKAPCLVILDGLDTLLPPENEQTPSSNTAALAHYFCTLFSPQSLPTGVLVVATAISSQGLHPLLNQKHVFGETIKIPPANKEVRREILRMLVDRQRSELEANSTSHRTLINGDISKSELDYVTLASVTEGYTASDLKDLVGGALQQAVIRSTQSGEQVTFTLADFTAAQSAFTPLSLRGVSLQKSDVKWADIGGLHEPRRVLRETLEWPTKYAQIFANCPLRLRSGLLLYGYPGCGKTLLASAVAKECGLNFISVKGPEILNKYIGASEKSVRDLFERASAAKPCVLFFDEFDSIAPKRGHDSTGVTDRVVNQLLTEMDGAQGLEGVYVLAATSRPDLIDSALLRPGRLDKSLLCDMPSKEDRLEIIQAVSAKLAFDPSIDFEMIAAETEGLSGADLQAVVYNAHLEVVQASIANLQESEESEQPKSKGKGKASDGKSKAKGNGQSNGDAPKSKQPKNKGWKQVAPEGMADLPGLSAKIEAILANTSGVSSVKKEQTKALQPVIEQKHLLKSLEATRPSVAPADYAKLRRIYQSFVADRDGTMGDGEGGRGTGTRATLM